MYQGNYLVEVVSGTELTATIPNATDDASDSDVNPDTDLTPTIVVGSGDVLDNVDIGLQASTSISGRVWNDLDTDGRREDGEDGIPDITINLYDAEGNLVATTMTTTDGNGSAGLYIFEDIPIGDYYVEVVLPDGTVLSPDNVGVNDDFDSEGTGANGPNTTNTFTTLANQETTGQDFGFYEAGSICGTVWQDSEDGTMAEVFEPGLDSVIANSAVYLIDPNTGDTLATTTTAADGTYCLEEIPVGSYIVTFGVTGKLDNYVQEGVGADPLNDSDVNTSTGETPVIFVGPGEVIEGVNAGIRLGALSVDLLYFTGYYDRQNEMNILDWSTAIEINNDRFEIERKVNGEREFYNIGQVMGQGNRTSPTAYLFQDIDLSESGDYYYRLKQFNYNGSHTYSNTILLSINQDTKYVEEFKATKVYPNPSSDKAQVVFTSYDDSKALISLHDFSGRIVQDVMKINTYTGSNLVQLDVNHLPQGTYVIGIQIGDTIERKKLIIKR